MSATNETTYLKLPQFVATDKPTWLGDFNNAMLKIDNNAATTHNTVSGIPAQIAAVDQKADAAVSTANSAKTTATSAQSTATSAQSTAAAAQSTATAAQSTANAAASDIAKVKAYLVELPNKGKKTDSNGISFVNASGASVGVTGAISKVNIQWALNEDGTYGKIYGTFILVNCTIPSGTFARIPANTIPIVKPSAAYNIDCAGVSAVVRGTSPNYTMTRLIASYFRINPNGAIDISLTPTEGSTPATQVTTFLFPCVYYFEDFGDSPVPAMTLSEEMEMAASLPVYLHEVM